MNEKLCDKWYLRPTTIVFLTSKYIYGLNAGYFKVYLERKGERASYPTPYTMHLFSHQAMRVKNIGATQIQ